MVPLTINPSPLFQIRLEDDTLTMRGTSSESVGCVLRGQLVLSITEPTKIREIKMNFQGRSKIAWNEASTGQCYRSEERILFQHDWIFLPAKKNYHILQPNNYHWNFELVIPGALPETIEGCEFGNVNYRLKAVAERSKLSINLNTQRKINIQRCLSSCEELDSIQSIIVANTWTDKIDYEFTTDSKAFTLGDKIPIHMTLIPLQKKLSIVRFNCRLIEHITYQIGTQVKEEFRPVHQLNDVKLDFDQVWNKTFEFNLPNKISLCHYDSQNEIIKIQHKLKFSVIFNNTGDEKDKNNSELKAALPIIITPVSSNSDPSCIPAPLADSSLPPIYIDHVI
ncbi:4077_t:CDS:2 [Diversispora eburnea]|uniref:4077_t:CDS:1 n=1 Tax=Diversispora eburnea TaxID=1213867 RepID=A0A9N9A5X3_9GLOM|nr:4077_t:CDS:2 [Diversispora eburnea]